MAPNSVQSTTKGWMPEATKVDVPASNFSVGNAGRKAAVLHLTQGNAPGVIARFKDANQRVSAHFLAKRDGSVLQFVSVIDTAYANGASWNEKLHCWVDPQGHLLKAPNPTPSWVGMVPPKNPNLTTISIERELLSVAERPSAAQNAAVVRILQYVQDTFPSFIAIWHHGTTLIGHCDISPVEKAHCPGPLCDYAGLAAAANGPVQPPPSYRVVGLPVYQRADHTGPLWGHLHEGEIVAIDNTANGHLADGRGFVDMQGLG